MRRERKIGFDFEMDLLDGTNSKKDKCGRYLKDINTRVILKLGIIWEQDDTKKKGEHDGYTQRKGKIIVLLKER